MKKRLVVAIAFDFCATAIDSQTRCRPVSRINNNNNNETYAAFEAHGIRDEVDMFGDSVYWCSVALRAL